MKKINSIYIVSIALAIFLYSMYSRIQSESAFFYGFAENKETEISHNRDVFVKSIHVTTGKQVKKGDLLMIVENTVLPVKINELQLKKEAVDVNTLQEKKEISNKISELRFSKIRKLNELNEKIIELDKKIALNASLYEGLKSIENKVDTIQSVEEIRLTYLKKNAAVITQNYNQEIAFQQTLLSGLRKPSQLKRDIIDTEINHFKGEQHKLSIYAPSDGLIGNIRCKEGENIAAFTTLLNFYQINPTLVKGFVHESLLLKVKVGDQLEISSSLHPEYKIKGEVTGLGSRIIEIPERLRKIPDFKTYGREVLIKIPAKNKFLQKEKVMLNTSLSTENLSLSSLFFLR